ncbi:MAG: cytochrome c oxidase, subunit [Acidimicrobiia bacterium]|nr:cytochrome c oxidase, subunit [Acidimicrobiia bacterium]
MGAVAFALGSLSGCSGKHSVFHPRTKEAERVALLGWVMLGIASVIFLLVMALLFRGLFRDPAVPRLRPRFWHRFLRGDSSWIALGGIAMPTAVVLLLSGLTVWALHERPTTGELEIQAIGHQYWWEIRYPQTGAVTANEFHIPVGRPVHVSITSTDVIHSLWVPELGPKRDMIPGHTTELTWRAEKAGTYRGQCAEFCGLQHAQMALIVTADAPEVFDGWLKNEAAPAAAPTDPEAQRGMQAFAAQPCASCHTVRGTAANGTKGPDLTHFAIRSTIGAGAMPNDRGHLGGWIADAQSTKPGNLMPPIALSPDELRSLLAYLEGLR